MCLSNISGLESAILNFYFQSGRKIFPMGELDTVGGSNHPPPLVADFAKKSLVARRLTTYFSRN